MPPKDGAQKMAQDNQQNTPAVQRHPATNARLDAFASGQGGVGLMVDETAQQRDPKLELVAKAGRPLPAGEIRADEIGDTLWLHIDEGAGATHPMEKAALVRGEPVEVRR